MYNFKRLYESEVGEDLDQIVSTVYDRTNMVINTEQLWLPVQIWVKSN